MKLQKLIFLIILLVSTAFVYAVDKEVDDWVLVGGEKPDLSKMPSSTNSPIQLNLKKTENVVCDVAGNLGTLGVSPLPAIAKKAVCKVCGSNALFKKNHPNVYKYLNCSTGESLADLTPTEIKTLCVDVIGKVGSGLGAPLTTTDARNQLAELCCNAGTFRTTHPNASRTLGCQRIPLK